MIQASRSYLASGSCPKCPALSLGAAHLRPIACLTLDSVQRTVQLEWRVRRACEVGTHLPPEALARRSRVQASSLDAIILPCSVRVSGCLHVPADKRDETDNGVLSLSSDIGRDRAYQERDRPQKRASHDRPYPRRAVALPRSRPARSAACAARDEECDVFQKQCVKGVAMSACGCPGIYTDSRKSCRCIQPEPLELKIIFGVDSAA
ncbi:hypothetical protein BU25DRAFT_423762 [Macroventuria anomochaeta]|uniref:Uncharacterized protein n=1 Tax=Macroventuria anomochaeta TaxID=301207 RepID=A0ACB6RSK7_9PLEO|nr:uncharacterized protein BU25DRAFT_423762 [Macroventuria anomochaeta]KAF2625026.1 hypothetical protein BU25DRAFT_423762 [Macroventuria anomochaeta]